MKTTNAIIVLALAFLTCAVTQAQTVTLAFTNSQPASYTCSTNQVITIDSFIRNQAAGSYGTASIKFHNGNAIIIANYEYGDAATKAVFTGVTNITVLSGPPSALTFTITTPTPQSLIPANAVVIPSDAAGPVQIVLESSSDLINWTSSLPGTYGNTHSNRFFRVRAIAQ